MPIKSLSQSSLLSFEKYSSMLAGNTKVSYGAYDLLETEILTGTQASVTFSSLNSTYGADYQHLQLRIVTRDNRAISGLNNIRMQVNSDSGSNYADHGLYGNGSSVLSYANTSESQFNALSVNPSNSDTADAFGVGVVDFLDCFETSKYLTMRSLNGATVAAGSTIRLSSCVWMNTNALDTILIYPSSASFVTGSRFSLYGLRSA
jgi:hypothetical protein